MGHALSQAFPTARRTFEEANDLLGYDLARLCFEGPAEDLTSTRNCQPAILTTSVAAWRVAHEHGVTGDIAMGHSLGEYSALVACGSLSFDAGPAAGAGARRRDHRRLGGDAGPDGRPAGRQRRGRRGPLPGGRRGVARQLQRPGPDRRLRPAPRRRPAARSRARPRHQGAAPRRRRRVPLLGDGARRREAARGALEREDRDALAALPLGHLRPRSSAASACGPSWPSSSRLRCASPRPSGWPWTTASTPSSSSATGACWSAWCGASGPTSRRSTWAIRRTCPPSWPWPGAPTRTAGSAGRARHRREQGDRGGLRPRPRAPGLRRRADLRGRPRGRRGGRRGGPRARAAGPARCAARPARRAPPRAPSRRWRAPSARWTSWWPTPGSPATAPRCGWPARPGESRST